MSTIAAIGERDRVAGFAFAGVQVRAAEDPDTVRAAWRALPADIALLILTRSAQAALRDELDGHGRPLCVVMPS
jgi:vacuolar-type H+-ATPase subunit F/Vma7